MLRDARLATRNAPVRFALMTFSNFSSVIRMSNASAVTPAFDDQHLDRTLVLLDLGERAVDGVAVGDVTLDAEQVLVGHAGAAVRDGDLVPVGGEPLGDREADAPVSAGDQHGTRDELRTGGVGLTRGFGWIVGHSHARQLNG